MLSVTESGSCTDYQAGGARNKSVQVEKYTGAGSSRQEKDQELSNRSVRRGTNYPPRSQHQVIINC